MNKKNILFIRIPPWFGIKNPHPREAVLPFSVGYAATELLKHKAAVKVFDAVIENTDAQGIINYILSENPDLVIMDCRFPAAHIAKNIASKVKSLKSNIFFILFGQENISGFDAYVTGELELLSLHILSDLENKSNLNKIVINENDFVENLDSLPHIDYSLFKLGRYQKKSAYPPVFGKKRWGFILSSRGCPYQCIFCSPVTRTSIGKNYRAHSPAWIVDEIVRLMNTYRVNALSFEDDNFAFDKNRVEYICGELLRRNIKVPWTARTRVDLLDEGLLIKMKKAGCFSLGIGVESGNNRILHVLKKKQDKEKILDTIRIMKKVKIAPLLFLMIGNPTETYEEMQETFKFAKAVRPIMLQFHYFTIYPGSEIFSSLKGKGLNLKNISHYDGCRYNLSVIPDKILKASLKKFYIKYYLSLEYLWVYIIHRLPYVMFDTKETRLILDTLKFLFRGKRDKD